MLEARKLVLGTRLKLNLLRLIVHLIRHEIPEGIWAIFFDVIAMMPAAPSEDVKQRVSGHVEERHETECDHAAQTSGHYGHHPGLVNIIRAVGSPEHCYSCKHDECEAAADGSDHGHTDHFIHGRAAVEKGYDTSSFSNEIQRVIRSRPERRRAEDNFSVCALAETTEDIVHQAREQTKTSSDDARTRLIVFIHATTLVCLSEQCFDYLRDPPEWSRDSNYYASPSNTTQMIEKANADPTNGGAERDGFGTLSSLRRQEIPAIWTTLANWNDQNLCSVHHLDTSRTLAALNVVDTQHLNARHWPANVAVCISHFRAILIVVRIGFVIVYEKPKAHCVDHDELPEVDNKFD